MTGCWRSPNVRLRLTLWYVAAMVIVLAVYVAAVYGFVSAAAADGINQQLRRDYQWAAAAVDRAPDGTFTWTEPQPIAGEQELPWVQVWGEGGGELLFANAEAQRRHVSSGQALAMRADDPGVTEVVAVAAEAAPMRILSQRMRVRDLPVVLQVGRSEGEMRKDLADLLLVLLLGLPLAVAAAGCGGYALAKRALAPVERVTEQMRRFTADVSHEVRTPLTAIRSVGEVGLREHRSGADYRSIIGSMLEEADRLASLVDLLLTLSRAETATATLAAENVELASLADEVVAYLGVLAEEKGQTLVIERVAPAVAKGDRMVLRQALINLVDNAIKFTPPGGAIHIRLGETAHETTLEVADTGPGIDAGSRGRIFERFYRSNDQAETPAGTGLGLSIAKGAVEANGGRLTLEQSGPAGSVFRMALKKGFG